MTRLRLTLVLGLCVWTIAEIAPGVEDHFILPAEIVANIQPVAQVSVLVILGNEQIKQPLIGPAPAFVAKPQGGSADFLVKGQQVGIRIEEKMFLTPATSVS